MTKAIFLYILEYVMVSTVTVSTITTIAALSVGVGIGVFVVLLLIGFLTAKELLGTSSGKRQKLLSRSLVISIIPLLMGFAVIVGLKVAEILA
ncbi:MAG: hypothetical protein WCD72_01940 [Dehalococcoidia bacterium]